MYVYTNVCECLSLSGENGYEYVCAEPIQSINE